MANFVYLSPSYISKIFKVDTGLNFNAYLNESPRWKKAKGSFLNDGLSLSEISRQCGFEDQGYFSKVFKKITAFPPALSGKRAAGNKKSPAFRRGIFLNFYSTLFPQRGQKAKAGESSLPQ